LANQYIDNYPTCQETHATFRVYHDKVTVGDISAILGLEPSSIQEKGEKVKITIGNRSSLSPRPAQINGWFLSTEGIVNSKDVRRHVDHLTTLLNKQVGKINHLISLGCKVGILCYWSSSQGHGGPTLSKKQLQELSSLGIDFSFDFYC
jgi:hypothetical protein